MQHLGRSVFEPVDRCVRGLRSRTKVEELSYLLGIDNGGTITKAVVFGLDGRTVGSCSVSTVMKMPTPGFTERDMDELWQANVNAVAGALADAGIGGNEVLAIATTGHGNGMYLVDGNGQPVAPGIVSTDTRAASVVQQWLASGVGERVLERTMQSLWAGQPAALLAWHQRHRPKTLSRAKWVLMCKDYIRFKLTGEIAAEITDCSGTSLMNVRDRRLDPELMAEFGLEEYADRMPSLIGSADCCGTVSDEAAAATGLSAGTPVAGGLFDIDACAIATGIVDDSRLCLIAGTWSRFAGQREGH